jgi:DNA invertase Pin-like site-specific DNA recombinase
MDEQIAKRWLSQKIKEGIAKRRAEGKRIGQAPASEELRQRIVALREEGLSYQKIADRLQSEGVPTPQRRRGAKWRHSTVKYLIERGAK